MKVSARGRSIRWLLVAALGLGSGCRRTQPAVEPPVSPACNPADDCNDLLGGSTVRQHSDSAATFVELTEGCPYAPKDVPPLASLDARSIPEFDAARSRTSNMHRGDEWLQDIDLHEHMMGMQPQLFACVDLAACYKRNRAFTGWGELEFDFELYPDGHVVAVSVVPSPGLAHRAVVACARRTLAGYRFPSYDGGQLMINYTVTIEAVDDPQ